MAPAEIRITDLGDPVLTPEQQAVKDATAGIEVELTEQAVLDAAMERTGLSDFGADDFRERLQVWLASVDEDADLWPSGRLANYEDAVRRASQRLLLEDLLRRHPEILEVEIDRPIVIAGLPRSGTTHLLNLISADRRLRSLPLWECLEPIPDPREAGVDGEDPRLTRCRETWGIQGELLPHMNAMHEMDPLHVHEEVEILGLDFSTYDSEWKARVPRWRDYYYAHDQRPHYAYMKKVLKALTWLRGPHRWVLKTPQHMEQLLPLIETFPDATVVITHRDPASVIVSIVTMMAYGDRLRRRRVDLAETAEYWIERVEHLLRACVRDRAELPEARSIDCLFHEFMADDIGMVRRIYAAADLDWTLQARRAFEDFMALNPRGKHGRVVYDLKGDFGIDPEALRERFAFYIDAFGVEVGA